MWHWFLDWLGRRSTLILVFWINLLGTIYGYYWYKNQLLQTDLIWWVFVPDSPTASLFFTIVLLGFILGKRWKLIEAFATVTLFKYGIWASVMIIWTKMLGGELVWEHYMLIISHLAMAIQALLYISHYHFDWRHLVVVALWTITNDVLDYNIPIFPWLDSRMHPYLEYIYFFTVSLSILSLLIFYLFVARKNKKIL